MVSVTLVRIIGFILVASLHVSPMDGKTIANNSSNGYRVSLHNRTLLIATIFDAPFLTLKHKGDSTFAEDNVTRGTILDPSLVEGYMADLVDHICHKRLNISYKFLIETKYGRETEKGVWDGIMGTLVNRQADLAVAALTINAARMKAVDFTQPVLHSGISIMMKKSAERKSGLFFFLIPLSKEVWVCIILAYIFVSVILFFINRISFDERFAQAPNRPQLSFGDALCFPFGGLRHRNGSHSIAGRVVLSSWWLFCTFLFSTYIVILIHSYPLDTKNEPPIETFEDLAKQTAIRYGVTRDSSTMAFFNQSTVGTIKAMWNFMQNHKDESFVHSTREGIERVRQSNGRFAFLLESTVNEYANNHFPCDTIRVGGNLNYRGYGIATPLGSNLREAMNVAVLELGESGVFETLKQKWFYQRNECKQLTANNWKRGHQLTLSHIAGVFCILLIGLSIALLILFLELLLRAKEDSTRSNQNICKVMYDNLRHSMTGQHRERDTQPPL